MNAQVTELANEFQEAAEQMSAGRMALDKPKAIAGLQACRAVCLKANEAGLQMQVLR